MCSASWSKLILVTNRCEEWRVIVLCPERLCGAFLKLYLKSFLSLLHLYFCGWCCCCCWGAKVIPLTLCPVSSVQQVGQLKWCVGGEALGCIDGRVNRQQSHIDREDFGAGQCKRTGEHRWRLLTFAPQLGLTRVGQRYLERDLKLLLKVESSKELVRMYEILMTRFISEHCAKLEKEVIRKHHGSGFL